MLRSLLLGASSLAFEAIYIDLRIVAHQRSKFLVANVDFP